MSSFILHYNFKSLIGKLKSNIFFQNVAIVASGSIIARIIGLFTSPVLTRIYSPEDYGIFSFFSAVVGVAGSLSTLRYAVTIPLAEKEELADHLLYLSFLVTLAFTLFWSFVIIFFRDLFGSIFSVQNVSSYLWILPIIFFGIGIYEALSFWATRHKQFLLITKTTLYQSIFSRGIKIGLGLIGIKPMGLLIGLIVSQVAGIGSIFRKLLKERPNFITNFSWKGIKYAAIRYKRFPLFQSWSQLLLSLGAHLPTIFIASIYGAKVVGLYGLAHTMISMPMSILGNSISQVYYAEIAKYGKANKEKIYKLTFTVVKKLLIIALLPTLVLITVGPWLFSIFFGQRWFDAGIYARILSVIILFRLVSSPVMQCLNVLEKQGFQLFFNITRTLMILLIFYLAKTNSWAPTITITLYSIFMSVFYFSIILIVLNLLRSSKDSHTFS